MNCKEFENIIFDFIDGNLTDQQTQNADLHIQECKKCNEKYQFILQTNKLIGIEKQKSVNPFLETRILQRLEAKPKTFFVKVLQPALIAVLLVVSILLGNFAANFILNSNYSSTSQQISQNRDTVISYVVNEISNDDLNFIDNQ